MAEVPAGDGVLPRRVSSVVLDVTLLAYLVVVLVITLWPSPPDPASFGWLERALAWAHARGLPASVQLPVVEAVANVALFVPLGALALWARGARPLVAVAAGCALSASIELTQLALPERVPTVQDVAMNTLGAALGVCVVVVSRSWGRTSPAVAGP